MTAPLSSNLQVSEDERSVTIFGIHYDIELFRHLGVAPIGSRIEIIARADGVVTLRRLPDETKAESSELRATAQRFHDTYCPTCPDNPCGLGIELRAPSEPDELTVKFPRAWAPYLQAVILGALGDMDGDGDCRWHLNELQKFLGRASEKTEGGS